ncbi:hypothetical protein NP493_269g01004 [Ridgeia piscesae]|uniref:C2H2-type domain-containing protein n=1 Tax=Ridgeia piscesae TaxID=27915 RepID=A0AAD9NXR0_RIDPI|nr:hypothetical protein NP493_269g01004 [Ridgeia piscesae]
MGMIAALSTRDSVDWSSAGISSSQRFSASVCGFIDVVAFNKKVSEPATPKPTMPKGFLVKRTKRHVTCSWRHRTEEERSDSGSEPDNAACHALAQTTAQPENSPDSGYGGRQANASPREIVGDNMRCFSLSPSWSASSSPSCVVATSRHGSPFHLPTFGCLTMSSPCDIPMSNGRDDLTGSPQGGATSPMSPNNNNNNKRAASDALQTATVVDNRKLASRKSPKKPKAARKITFEATDTTSPVLGTIIRDAAAVGDYVNDDSGRMRNGDIDPSLNMVDVSPEARAELERIENHIGDYVCRLCRGRYEDAFRLAQHRCSCIVHVEYRCPECDKAFNCPANLASHRRWHKPRANSTTATATAITNNSKSSSKSVDKSDAKSGISAQPLKQPNCPVFPGNDLGQSLKGDQDPSSGAPRKSLSPAARAGSGDDAVFPCDQCAKTFRHRAYLRKHVASCHAVRAADALAGEAVASGHVLPVCACGVCGRTFADPAVRDAHVRLHAVSQSLGGARYPELLQLQRRLEAALADRQPALPCKYCDGSFHSMHALACHIDKCHAPSNRQLLMVPLPLPTVDRTS